MTWPRDEIAPSRGSRQDATVEARPAIAPIRRRSSVSAALRSMCRGFTRATVHSHQRGHFVTWKVCTILVSAPTGSRLTPIGAVNEQPCGDGAPRQLAWAVDRENLARAAPAQPARAAAPAEPSTGRRLGGPVQPADLAALVAPFAGPSDVGDDRPHRLGRCGDDHLDAAAHGDSPFRPIDARSLRLWSEVMLLGAGRRAAGR